MGDDQFIDERREESESLNGSINGDGMVQDISSTGTINSSFLVKFTGMILLSLTTDG